MSNTIITNGYGESGSTSQYADIDWSKKQYNLSFKTNINKLNFSTKIYSTKFKINTNTIKFKPEQFTTDFNIKTHDIKFSVTCC